MFWAGCIAAKKVCVCVGGGGGHLTEFGGSHIPLPKSAWVWVRYFIGCGIWTPSSHLSITWDMIHYIHSVKKHWVRLSQNYTSINERHLSLPVFSFVILWELNAWTWCDGLGKTRDHYRDYRWLPPWLQVCLPTCVSYWPPSTSISSFPFLTFRDLKGSSRFKL